MERGEVYLFVLAFGRLYLFGGDLLMDLHLRRTFGLGRRTFVFGWGGVWLVFFGRTVVWVLVSVCLFSIVVAENSGFRIIIG